MDTKVTDVVNRNKAIFGQHLTENDEIMRQQNLYFPCHIHLLSKFHSQKKDDMAKLGDL